MPGDTFKVRGLKAVKDMLGRLARATRVPSIAIDIPSEEAQKLNWLIDGTTRMPARDVGFVNDKMLSAMVQAWLTGIVRVKGGEDSPELPWKLAGEAYLKVLTDRVAFSGGDVRGKMPALAPSTIKKKKGSTRLFYDSGALLRALKSATVTVQGR